MTVALSPEHRAESLRAMAAEELDVLVVGGGVTGCGVALDSVTRGLATGLLEQREAVLHGIREGIVAVDLEGRLTLVNDEARRLLALEPDAVGRMVTDVIPAGRIREVLLGDLDRPDLLLVTEGRVLVANRMPVFVRGQVTGAVVSLRDRTELAEVTRRLGWSFLVHHTDRPPEEAVLAVHSRLAGLERDYRYRPARKAAGERVADLQP